MAASVGAVASIEFLMNYEIMLLAIHLVHCRHSGETVFVAKYTSS